MKMKTKDLVVAALLTSLSILIPNIFPTIPLGPFSATFASHLPTMLSMFISPVVALATSAGSPLGFWLKGAPAWIVWRAAMHIPFAILGAYMNKKNSNIYLMCFVTMIVHGLLEIVAVLPFLGEMNLSSDTLMFLGMEIQLGWPLVIFFGTIIHHAIDFAIALAVIPALRKTGYIKK